MFPLYDENRSKKRPLINWGLIAINVIVFIWQLSNGMSYRTMRDFGEIPSLLMGGKRLYTVITSMFLHGDFVHIGSNMYYLFIFGDNIEDAFGHTKYLILYLIFGIVGGIVHSAATVFFQPWDSNIPAIGASGAISGVLGAYLVFFPNARIVSLVFYYFFIRMVRIPALAFLGFWFLLQLLMSGTQSGVAYWAHIGGFIAGLAVAGIFKVFRSLRSPRREPEFIYIGDY